MRFPGTIGAQRIRLTRIRAPAYSAAQRASCVPALGVFLNGEGIDSPDAGGDQSPSMCCSMGDWGKEWIVVLDTNKPLPEEEEQRYKPKDEIPVESRAVKVLRRVN